jgi:glycerophosphoryl diester phosphodiesterase
MVLAHRGGAGPWRENTLEAFAGAVRSGADGVELDVRRTADGKLVVHHDAEVPGAGPVHALRAEDLPPWVPGLDEALAVCAGVVVNVEVKNTPLDPGYDPEEKVAAAVVSAIAAAGAPAGEYAGPTHLVVSSFWPPTLEAVRDAGSGVALGLLVHPSLDAVAAGDIAAALGCVAVHPFYAQVTPAFVAGAHDRGMAVVTWTVNEAADLAAVVAAGVDGVISDRVPETLRALGRG